MSSSGCTVKKQLILSTGFISRQSSSFIKEDELWDQMALKWVRPHSSIKWFDPEMDRNVQDAAKMLWGLNWAIYNLHLHSTHYVFTSRGYLFKFTNVGCCVCVFQGICFNKELLQSKKPWICRWFYFSEKEKRGTIFSLSYKDVTKALGIIHKYLRDNVTSRNTIYFPFDWLQWMTFRIYFILDRKL